MLSKIPKKYLQVYIRGAPQQQLAATIYSTHLASFHTQQKLQQSNNAALTSSTMNKYFSSIFSSTHLQRMFSTSANDESSAPSRGEQQEGERKPRQYSKYGAGLTRNFNDRVPVEDSIRDTAAKLKDQNLSVGEVATLLRHLSRQIGTQGSGLAKEVFKNEELRKNINLIGAEALKVVDQLTPKTLVEFSNFINTCRIQKVDDFLQFKLKNGTIKRANLLFQDEQFKEELDGLTFDQNNKILSDLVHYGYVVPIAQKISKDIVQGETLKSFSGIVRLLDSIFYSVDGIEQLEFLIRKYENLLKEKSNFDQLTPSEMVRLLKVYSYASYTNLTRHPIQDKFCQALENKIHEFQEQDVIALLRSFQYIGPDVMFSNKLFNMLNNTVVETALQRKEDVTYQFLISYLSVFHDLKQTRDLNPNQRQTLTALLEEKLDQSRSLTNFQLQQLSKVFIKGNRQSEIIKGKLYENALKHTKSLNYEQLTLVTSALKDIEKSKVLEFESEFITQIKDAKTKQSRVLGEWTQYIDGLKTKDDHRDLQKTLISKFTEVFKVNLSRTEAIDLLLHYRKIEQPSEQVNEMTKIMLDQYIRKEQLDTWAPGQLMNLYIWLQNPEEKNSQWIRDQYFPVLEDRFKALSPPQLQNYAKRAIHQDEITPAQAKNIQDFVMNQPNLAKINPMFVMKIAEKLLTATSHAGEKNALFKQKEAQGIKELTIQLYSKLPQDISAPLVANLFD